MKAAVRRALLLLGSLALAACSAEREEPDGALPSQEMEPARPASGPHPGDSPATGGDGSPIRLTPLTAADREADPPEGELGCAFSAGEGTLLVAMGNVGDSEGHAQGLAKIGGYRERLFARESGGFDGLPDGAVFSGQGMTFTVTRTSDSPPGGGESPSYPAELLLQRADGAEWVIAGLWTCGP